MNSQNIDDDSMDFSVIEANPEPQANADFSVRSLLGEEEEPQFTKPSSAVLNLHKSVEDVFSKLRNLKVTSGKSILNTDPRRALPQEGQQFLRDLSRMQKQLSFQSSIYNIYEDNPNSSTQIVQSNKSKTFSILKTTKQETNKSTNKSISKEEPYNLSDYYGPLIIDFRKEHRSEYQDPLDKDTDKLNRYRSKLGINDCNTNSYLSSDYSDRSKVKVKKNTKSRSKDKLQSFFGRDNSKSARNQLGHDFKKSKSKSKSHGSRLGSASKSQNSLKLSSNTQKFTSKVFTQYYGTDIDIDISKKKPQPKMKKELHKLKSRQKSVSTKTKLGLLSPRGKAGTATKKK